MPYTIHITGIDVAQAMLNINVDATMRIATENIAADIEEIISPYPPVTAANDPANVTGRWYERGKGGFRMRKDGAAVQTSASQKLGNRWGTKRIGRWGTQLGNTATYAPYVHSKEKQARALQRIGWKTDEGSVRQAIASGAVKRIVTQAILGAMRRK